MVAECPGNILINTATSTEKCSINTHLWSTDVNICVIRERYVCGVGQSELA